MIYLVSRTKTLFSSTQYSTISCKEALSILYPLKEVQFDTETTGLCAHSKELLTVQLGNKKNQVVFDWTTLTLEEKSLLKEYFESDRLFLTWNGAFDLGFLYKQGIWPKNIWDGMIVEKLLWLGYPAGLREMSLKAAAWNYLQYDLDKTVRGKIINEGLTESVVVYAAGDVQFLEDIKKAQDLEVEKQNLQKAVKFECEFLKSIAYFKHCGVHLDRNKWKTKMDKDLNRLIAAEIALNNWVTTFAENQEGKERATSVKVEYCTKLGDKEFNPEIPSNAQYLGKKEYNDYGHISTYVQYEIPININTFVYRNLQGDLWEGFDTKLKCKINWSSSKQVIPFFKLLGIHTKTFDKKTKKEKDSIEEKLLSPQKDAFPILPLFLEYQKAAKVTSTYGENWLNAINKSTGRIHPDYYSLGTDTGRISSGGGLSAINVQNLPHDAETRACFTAESGNKLICIDYQSQESRIIASVANDKAMIDILENGCGDIHSLVAYMSYPDIIPRDTKIEEISKKYKQARQDAKGIEFAVNYGGDANTIANNKGIPLKEAQEIYNNFMKGFPGLCSYQDYCRKEVMKKGYILMNPITGHRAHIFDWDNLSRIQSKFNNSEFWEYYRQMKKEDPYCDTVQDVKHYFQRKSASEKQSINYRIQNRGACCFKLASIKFFNWVVSNNYQNIVKMCVPVHDEFLLECPEELSELVLETITKCMVEGAKPFCPNVYLGADGGIYDHWVH